MIVVRLSAIRTSRLYPPGNISGNHFFYSLSRPQDYSAAGRIMSMENSDDAIGTGIVARCLNRPHAPGSYHQDLLPQARGKTSQDIGALSESHTSQI